MSGNKDETGDVRIVLPAEDFDRLVEALEAEPRVLPEVRALAVRKSATKDVTYDAQKKEGG